MAERTPDQIRRDTVPTKRYWLKCASAGGFLGLIVWCGGWWFRHPEQIRRYPEYVAAAIHSKVDSLPRAGKRPEMTANQLRYALFRFGNKDHRYDTEIIRRGWYPKGEESAAWVYENAAVEPLYSAGPRQVLEWPLALTVFTFLLSLVVGLAADYRYRSRIIAGIPFDGSIVTTVTEYNKKTRGDGMSYVVRPWKDR